MSPRPTAAPTPNAPSHAAAAPGTRPPARWAVTVSLAGLALFFLALAIREIWAVDLWWQLRTGQWIVDHRSVPSHDTLSYTAGDHPWIEMRWLYCVAAYLLWQVGGSTVLILCQAALVAAAFAVALWPSRRVFPTIPGILFVAGG